MKGGNIEGCIGRRGPCAMRILVIPEALWLWASFPARVSRLRRVCLCSRESLSRDLTTRKEEAICSTAQLITCTSVRPIQKPAQSPESRRAKQTCAVPWAGPARLNYLQEDFLLKAKKKEIGCLSPSTGVPTKLCG